jgi:hypothetical protein
VLEPLITAVGRVFTVIIALPLISPGRALQLSLTEVRVYVLVVVGDTGNKYTPAIIPFTVTGAVPSV